MEDGTPKSKDVVYFGRINFRNQERLFGAKRRDRRQHMYVIGKSGTGKSVLLHNLILQDIMNGDGVCVVDPHGELVEGIVTRIPRERLKDVIYFNPADIDYHLGFNVLELPDPKYKHLVASGLMAIFTKIWANVWSARMEYIMNNAILALLETPDTTLLGITRILVDKEYRQKIISNVKDPVVKAFWVNEYEQWRDQFRNEAIAPIQNKVGQFLSTSLIRNVVGQAKSTIDIFDVMNSKKIFLVNVSKGRIGEDNSALLGAMLITKIQLAAMERIRIPEEERADFFLYIDEFQNFGTDSFAGILSEARKYRLDLILAHQYVGQLVTGGSGSIGVSTKVRDAVFGNVGTMIVFRVGATDAEFLENEFAPEFTIEDIVNLPNYNIYLKLMVDGVASRPFSATTLPPFKAPGSAVPIDEIIETTRKNYARKREVVEREISRWSGVMQDDDEEVTFPGRAEAPASASVPASAPSGVSAAGKYPVVCSNCGKKTTVNFKPTPGRPVYCSECFAKIKAGEKLGEGVVRKPVEAVPSPAPAAPVSSRAAMRDTSALSALGIEFEAPQKQKESAPVTNSPLVSPLRDEASLSLSELAKPRSDSPRKPKETRPSTQVDVAGLRDALKEALGKEEEKEAKQ